MSIKITDSLYLASVKVPRSSSSVKLSPQPTNHIVAIDCSGSMSGDLPLIRTQLKEKLPHLLADGDTISIIWFSGKGEFGTLIKGEPVATLKDLSSLYKAIDRWLKPVCLTGFKEPLEEASRVIDELGGVCSLFFMSDGYDNQSGGTQTILKAVRDLAPKCASATFVEYGHYCNHPLMVSMAEEAGGTLILNEDFKTYQPNFEASMKKRLLGVKRIEVPISGDVLRGFVFALEEGPEEGTGSLITFKVEGGVVKVPEHLQEVHYLTPTTSEAATDFDASNSSKHVYGAEVLSSLYAAIALFAQRVDSDVVLPLLKLTGDVRFIKMFASCFGKQKYAEFTDLATRAAFNAGLRLQEGYDPAVVPDENAFTVFDLLRTLSEDEDNYLLLDSQDFKYNRTGRTREEEVIIPEDTQKQIDALDAEADAAAIEKLKAPYQPLKFKATPMPNGVPIRDLVFNETRPNVSVRTRRIGTVDIKVRKAGGFKGVLPDQFPSFIFRNYTIIRDGLINVDRLPVRITKATVQRLFDAGMPIEVVTNPEGETLEQTRKRVNKAGKDREVNVVLDLRALPVINRGMIQKLSAADLFKSEYDLTQARASQKVFGTLLKELEGASRDSEGFKVLYGEEAALWLKDQGFTDFNGFQPKSRQAESTDSYVGKELEVKLKGLSSIPSLNEFKTRVASGKALTASQTLLKPSWDAFTKFQESEVYKTAPDKTALAKTWLKTSLEAVKKDVQVKLYEAAQVRFSVIVGQTWFKEFGSLEENSLDVQVASGDLIQGTAVLKEIQVAI